MQPQNPEEENVLSEDFTDVEELVRLHLLFVWRCLLPLPLVQQSQRLPTEVLGIVAKYLKDEGQDRTCANLNETSQGLYDETLEDLWTTIRVRLEGESGEGNLHGQLQRILRCKGAKHIQYVWKSNPA